MSARDAISILRAFVVEQHPPGSAAALVAQQIAGYLEMQGALTLDEVLGVAANDAWPWWRVEQREAERAAARDLVAVCGGAREAHQWLSRFAQGRGRFLSGERQFEDERADAALRYLRATHGRVPATPKTLDRAADDGG